MSDRPDPTPAALYARVSSDRQDVDLASPPSIPVVEARSIV